MKKLIFFGLLAVAVYKFYQHAFISHGKGATGSTMAQVFVGPGCNMLCSDVEDVLKSRNVSYELIDVSTPEGSKYGINQYPVTLLGSQTVVGNARTLLISALAETYGESVLTPGERMAMRNHFDQNGNPLVVLYGTQWCPYCKRQRQYFADHGVSYSDVDVESSSAGKLAYDTLQGGGYPLVYVGYRRFDGYKEKEILDAIAALK